MFINLYNCTVGPQLTVSYHMTTLRCLAMYIGLYTLADPCLEANLFFFKHHHDVVDNLTLLDDIHFCVPMCFFRSRIIFHIPMHHTNYKLKSVL